MFSMLHQALLASLSLSTVQLPDWEERPYMVALPDIVAEQESDPQLLPVVVMLHAYASNALEQISNTCPDGKFDHPKCIHALGNRQGFITIFPNGPKIRSDSSNCRVEGAVCYPRSWRFKDRCESEQAVPPAEVGTGRYLLDVLADAARRYPIDLNRVYFSGMSLGARKAMAFGCHRGSKVDAVATVAGVHGTCECDLAEPPPMLLIHGTRDSIAPYNVAKRRVRKWAKRYGCEPTPDVSEIGNDRDLLQDGEKVIRQDYRGCRSPLSHIQLGGSGHFWPDGLQYRSGPLSRRINGNEVIWDFFSEVSP